MATFGLVHGAWHGGWCWERVIPELERLGHRAVAVDLPCDDPAATFSTYADVIVDALQDEPGDLVLVAHSLGGISAPMAAARLPVRMLVYLCALIPVPGRSLADQLATDVDMLVPGYTEGLSRPDDGGRTWWTDTDLAARIFFHDCDPATAKAAVERLRPQAMASYLDPYPLDALPHIPCAYVVGAEDRIVDPDWSRRAARERLGVEAIELPGGHSPFLARPAELAHLLDGLA